jgi:hypothetical protein
MIFVKTKNYVNICAVDIVEARSKEDIISTLDKNGNLMHFHLRHNRLYLLSAPTKHNGLFVCQSLKRTLQEGIRFTNVIDLGGRTRKGALFGVPYSAPYAPLIGLESLPHHQGEPRVAPQQDGCRLLKEGTL